jgi:CHRD domain-containing protein
MRRSYILIAVSLGLLAFASPGASQNPERFRIRLTTVPMDGGMRNTVAGFGSGTAMLAGNKLSISGSFDGLKSPATAAKLNTGVAKGVRGNAVADLTVSKSTKGTLSGSIDLTPEQVKGLRDGRFYVEIASEKAPEGNLWGWLLK